jgi:hypothetical protein
MVLFVRMAATKNHLYRARYWQLKTDYKKITGHYVNVTGPGSVCRWTKFLQLVVYIYFADQRYGPDLRRSNLYTSQWGHM